MKIAGILIVVFGVLLLLGGMGMDTTETTTTCYETDYSWNAADSSGCVETTYSNPAPKMGVVMLGLGMVLGGGVLASRSDSTNLTKQAASGDSREITSPDDEKIDALVDMIQDRENEEDSE